MYVNMSFVYPRSNNELQALIQKCPCIPGPNWNLEMLGFAESGKLECPEKNLSEQSREPTTNSTHVSCRRGGRSHHCSISENSRLTCCNNNNFKYLNSTKLISELFISWEKGKRQNLLITYQTFSIIKINLVCSLACWNNLMKNSQPRSQGPNELGKSVVLGSKTIAGLVA